MPGGLPTHPCHRCKKLVHNLCNCMRGVSDAFENRYFCCRECYTGSSRGNDSEDHAFIHETEDTEITPWGHFSFSWPAEGEVGLAIKGVALAPCLWTRLLL